MTEDTHAISPKKQIFTHFAIIGKAVSHGHRLELIEHLAQGEYGVEALANTIGLSIANTSQHLQQLRRAGLVASRRSGQHILYSLTSETVVELLSILRKIAESNISDIQKIVSEHYAPQDDLEPLTREELLGRIENGDAVIIDLRPEHEYSAGHVRGSKNIPLDELAQKLKQFSKKQTIIAYCRGPYCALAYRAVHLLRDKGYDARRLEDGFPEWKMAGFPVEEVEAPE